MCFDLCFFGFSQRWRRSAVPGMGSKRREACCAPERYSIPLKLFSGQPELEHWETNCLSTNGILFIKVYKPMTRHWMRDCLLLHKKSHSSLERLKFLHAYRNPKLQMLGLLLWTLCPVWDYAWCGKWCSSMSACLEVNLNLPCMIFVVISLLIKHIIFLCT